MNLLRKFAILLGLFALTVIVGLGAALLFGAMLEREVAGPFRQTTKVLTDLARLNHSVGTVERLVVDGSTGDVLETALLDMEAELEAAGSTEDFDKLVGPTAARNLRVRTDESTLLTRAWASSAGSGAGSQDARRSLAAIHEVVEAIEERVLAEAARSADFGDEMRRLHHLALFAGMLASLLFGVLAVMLMRRWVLAPVATLGDATQRIARGDFEHRVRIRGRDELAALGEQVNAMAGSIAAMQREAVERERLAAVGEMVRRLAHNLRNPLAGIRNLAELSHMRSADNPPVRELQTEIITAVDRFNVWLKELLNVTSPMRVDPGDHALKPWVEGIVAAHKPLARVREVSVEVDLAKAPARATFDARHLEHAVVAILTNALQASPRGGRVDIRVGPWSPPEPGDAARPGPWWEIAIHNEGDEIPPETRERMFLPYFTTKQDGNGIGLAIALQVVKRHGGRIDFSTRKNRGTCFWMRLPADPPVSEDP